MDRGEQLISALWDMMNKRRALEHQALKHLSPDLNPSEVRCIDYVGAHTNVNATRLAEAFYMTTGAASKLTKKLLSKGLISRFQKLENRKEVYFRLTPEGETIFKAHAALQEEFAARDEAVFHQLTEEDYETILSFARNYSAHLEKAGRRLR